MSLMFPFNDLTRVLNDINQTFNQPFFGPARAGRGQGEQGREFMSVWAPAVNVIEEENDIKVEAQVPGVKPDELEIDVDNNSVSIFGQKTEAFEEGPREERKGSFHRREIVQGSFYRRIDLPTEVQADKAQANFENGILTVVLPIAQERRRHRIRLGGGSGSSKQISNQTKSQSQQQQSQQSQQQNK